MNNILLTSLVLALTIGLSAQSLVLKNQYFYGDGDTSSNHNEKGHHILSTQDGSLLIVGEDDIDNNFSANRTIVRKIDTDGSIIWERILTNPLFEFPYEIDAAIKSIELVDAYIILVIDEFQDVYGLFRLEKAAGIIQDVRRINTEYKLGSRAFSQISNTEFIVGTNDGQIHAYDRFLNPISTKTYSNNNPFPGFIWGNTIIDIEQLPDGNFLFVGQIDKSSGCFCFDLEGPGTEEVTQDIWLLKMNSSLSAPIFSKAVGSSISDYVSDATITKDNEIVLMGASSDCDYQFNPPSCTFPVKGPGNIGDGYTWIWKLDSDGNEDQNVFPFFFFDGNDRAVGRHIFYEPQCDSYYVTGFGGTTNYLTCTCQSKTGSYVAFDSQSDQYGYIQKLDNNLNVIADAFDQSGVGFTNYNHSVFKDGRLYTTGSKLEGLNQFGLPMTDSDDIVLSEFTLGENYFAPFGAVPRQIIDNQTTSSPIVVNDLTGNITYARVLVNIEHTWTSDLTIMLNGPNGGSSLFNRSCGSEDNIFINFGDDGIPSFCPLVDNGQNLPFAVIVEPVIPLSNIYGTDPNGTWELVVSDNAGGDEGTLLDWQLYFETDFCSSDCPPSFSGANNNLLTGIQSVDEDFETDGILQSNQLITNSATVDYDSGISIDLLQPFEVRTGSVFHAFIDGCGGNQ